MTDHSKDLGDLAKMTADEKHFILLIPDFFACMELKGGRGTKFS